MTNYQPGGVGGVPGRNPRHSTQPTDHAIMRIAENVMENFCNFSLPAPSSMHDSTAGAVCI